MTILYYFLLILYSVRCNIWDNLISGMAAPHVYFPDSFDVIVSTNSTLNNTYYMAFSSKSNQVRVQGNFSALDFKPKTFIDIYADLKTQNLSMVKENMCKSFDIPSNTSLPVVARLFNTIPLVTFYTGVEQKKYHNYVFANPLADSNTNETSTKVSLEFEEYVNTTKYDMVIYNYMKYRLMKDEVGYRFEKLIIEKLKKDLPEKVELVVLQDVRGYALSLKNVI